ncbi:MAG: tetratricopeptide repeat protein [Vicinamibacteria bacterium]
MRGFWAFMWMVTASCGFGVPLPPPLPPSNLEWGISLYRKGYVDDAILVLEQATHDAPDDPKSWTYLGLARLRQGEPKRALPALEKAIEIDPKFAEARFGRGWAYRLLGRRAAAIQELEAAVALNPTHSEAHHQLSLAHLESEEIRPQKE